MLLTITTTHRPPPTSATCCTRTRPASSRSSCRSARRTSSTPRRRPSAARPPCCSTSTRSAWSATARARPGEAALEQYVNDRPYVASSFLSVAIAQVFGSALAGRSKDRPELAETPVPLEARLAASAVPGRRAVPAAAVRAARLRRQRRAATPRRAVSRAGATARTSRVELAGGLPAARPAGAPLRPGPGARRRQALLGRRRRGREAAAPRRGLAGRAPGARADRPPLPEAPAQPGVDKRSPGWPRRAGAEPDDGRTAQRSGRSGRRGAGLSLNEQRLGAVLAVLKECGAQRVLDLGCGEGKLLQRAAGGAAVRRRSSAWTSRTARWRSPRERLQLDRLPDRQAAAHPACCTAR